MTSISTSSYTSAAVASTANAKPANLDAQKADCERQLADWTHCVSASTPTGKAKISELHSKLKDIDADIRVRDTTSSRNTSPAPASTPATTTDDFDGTYSVSAVVRSGTRSGSLINTEA
jgi:hypothetical protein